MTDPDLAKVLDNPDGGEDVIRAARIGAQVALATREPDPLDVERLAKAIQAVSEDSPGLLSDVDMLNDPAEGDPRPAAIAIAAEYARLA